MKVLLVNKFFYIKGGAETVYFQEIDMLKKAGVEVIAFSMQHEDNFPSDYAPYFVDNVDYHQNGSMTGKIKTAVNFIHNAQACNKLLALLRKEKPDIVHFHNIYHQLTPSLINIARQFGCKTVLTAHDYKIVCPSYTMLRDGKVCDACLTGSVFNAFKYRCQQGSASKSLLLSLEGAWQNIAKNYQALDVIVSPSEFLRSQLIRKLPNTRIDVIVNGINDSLPVEEVEDEGYLLFIGRLSREKGVATLARAHQHMRNNIPLKIAGSGPLYHDLVAQFPNAEFLGYQQQGEELNRLIKHARAVVVPSEYYENCSMSVLESMAFAKPVVGGRIGGIPEQIRDNVDGVLFEPGNVQALADVLDDLALNPQKAREMGLNARQRLREKYSLHKHTEALLALYQEIVNEK
ncbi:glycosyltransferase family 1 protein [Dickeya dianthicola]|uniref:Glycosyltransferase family 1 protein n=1 Tax=Dickeya dianthicola TaxID=204039 RepID=A0ABX9NPU7_9GAMM|nr:glycosyltransferase family 4 protein [Dickeya dianthicola]MCI4070148.1 glycosyltransferase family 4 protein [Dickeya dianthicola]MCI4113576.1 glycosyltransferase family 4 protein [Dickeya dianthicola]MCI4120674.1 glycosyltransferase family 4 protein [Dickeya dianthicola]MCI4122114.1 glycosyltransferase family 4 protein [Dickeya dianthicola]MCI4191405.1 glycosyltransferase family 4 protein [Dickeya dianthicola]